MVYLVPMSGAFSFNTPACIDKVLPRIDFVNIEIDFDYQRPSLVQLWAGERIGTVSKRVRRVKTSLVPRNATIEKAAIAECRRGAKRLTEGMVWRRPRRGDARPQVS